MSEHLCYSDLQMTCMISQTMLTERTHRIQDPTGIDLTMDYYLILFAYQSEKNE